MKAHWRVQRSRMVATGATAHARCVEAGSFTILAVAAKSEKQNLGAFLSERLLPEPLPAAPAGFFSRVCACSQRGPLASMRSAKQQAGIAVGIEPVAAAIACA